MTLRDYFEFLKRNWVVVVVCTVLGLLLAGGYSLIQTPKYSSTAELYVSVPVISTATPNERIIANRYARESITSYIEIVGSARVLEPVIENLDLATSPEQLSAKVTAASPANTLLLRITATDANPELAASIADEVAASLTDLVLNVLQKPLDHGDGAMSIVVIQPSSVASSPTVPNVVRNVGFGTTGGFVAGIILSAMIQSIRRSRRAARSGPEDS